MYEKNQELNAVIMKENVLVFMTERQEIYRLELDKVFWYSVCYPWEKQSCHWTPESRMEEKGTVYCVYRDGDVRLTIELEEVMPELRLQVAFMNCGQKKITDFTAGLSVPVVNHGKNKVTIPHLIYNDNPSAEPERIVAHIGQAVGEGVIVEEHRLPIPGVNVEWKQDGRFPFLTLLSVPDVREGQEEEYWSLGVLKEEDGESITSLSGPLMFNGMKDVVYGGRCTPLSYMKGYRTLQPGETLAKTYCIAWGQGTEEGKAFRNLVDVGYRILKPATTAVHSLEEMIEYKKKVMDTRYYENDTCKGYLTFGASNSFGNISGRPEFFLYGWTGQSIKLAWCDCMAGLKEKNDTLLKRGMGVADFFVRRGESRIKGLFCGYYVIQEDRFGGDWKNPDAALSSRIQGESLSDLVDLMLLFRAEGVEVPKHWEEAVRNACTFLMEDRWQTTDGIYPFTWELDGTIANQDINASGMPCVLVLAKAAQYFDCKEYLEYAQSKYEIYAEHHMKTFDRPFARATMDARCEDKEAGLYFFTAAAELYRMTGIEKFKVWAEIAADWILTFVFFWETGFQKGTACAENHFHTTGWPGVSVQNHHLDVFFPTYELYEFGKLTGNRRLMEMGMHVSDALTYGVCTKEGEWGYTVIGEQGEQYYQTNYFQVTYPSLLKYLRNFRGGMQVWNPSWITAQVMSSALKFVYEEK